MYGLNFCLAEVIHGDAGEISVGDLFEIDRWVAPREARMKIWIPGSSLSHERLLSISREITTLKNSNLIEWVEDPTEMDPTHIMSCYGSSWRIVTRDGKVTKLGKKPKAEAILEKIMSGRPVGSKKPRFFLHLPLSSRMQKIIASEINHYSDSTEILTSSQGAQYILVGRLSGKSIEYAWVLPNISRLVFCLRRPGGSFVKPPPGPPQNFLLRVFSILPCTPSLRPLILKSTTKREEEEGLAMPFRTKWIAVGNDELAKLRAVNDLRKNLLRLVKIRAWMQLSSPTDRGDFPYRLALKNSKTGEVKTRGPLMEGESYGVLLRAYKEKPGKKSYGRYVYVFSIDSFGKGELLFGDSENYFPVTDEFQAEIQPGDKEIFKIAEPFGVDTLFLLTTEEPITNTEVLDFKGVRREPEKVKRYTPLERLLYGLGSGCRGRPPVTHINWSIQRLPLLSKPQRQR